VKKKFSIRNKIEEIADLFLGSAAIRNFKIIIKNSVVNPFAKGLIILLPTIALILLAVKIFSPSYSKKIWGKANFYFLHYLNLDGRVFDEVRISGNSRVSEEEIMNIIESAQKDLPKESNSDYQPLIHTLMMRIKSELPWVDQVVVTRNMPDILNVSIVEYEPFAVWENNGEKFLTNKDGKLLPYEESEEFKNMIILSGENANLNARSLFNIFTSDPEFSRNVYSATWISNRRWDIRLESGIIIKLPQSNISDAWQHLIKIYNMTGSIIGLQTIDLRIKDKVYLEYSDSVIKELKNL
jgi:cell division protein FtsQ